MLRGVLLLESNIGGISLVRSVSEQASLTEPL